MIWLVRFSGEKWREHDRTIWRRAGVGFGGRGSGLTLSETAETGGKGHAQTGGDIEQAVLATFGGLSERGRRQQKSGRRHEQILKLTHWSYSVLPEFRHQWVVEVHRADPLTLMAVMLRMRW